MDNEAVFAKKIQERSIPTVDGNIPFKFFDGAVMGNFKYPPKAWEATFCRRETTTEPSCRFGGRGFLSEEEYNDELTCGSKESGESPISHLSEISQAIHSPLVPGSTRKLLESSRVTARFRRPDLLSVVDEALGTNNDSPAPTDSFQVYNPVVDRQIRFQQGILGHQSK